MRTSRHIFALDEADASARVNASAAQSSHDDAAVLITSASRALSELHVGLSDLASGQDPILLDHRLGTFIPAPIAATPRAHVPVREWCAALATVAGFAVFAAVYLWPSSQAATPTKTAARVTAAVAAAAPVALHAVAPAATAPDVDANPPPVEGLDAGSHIYASRFGKSDGANLLCLAQTIYYEARGEPAVSQIAVAQVVLNRVRSGRWGKSICAVVLQGRTRGAKCQFSYACRSFYARPRGESWAKAWELANDAIHGRAWLRETVEATHYHTTDVSPIWRVGMEPVAQFGKHIFYRTAELSAALSLEHAGEAQDLETTTPALTTSLSSEKLASEKLAAETLPAALEPTPIGVAERKSHVMLNANRAAVPDLGTARKAASTHHAAPNGQSGWTAGAFDANR